MIELQNRIKNIEWKESNLIHVLYNVEDGRRYLIQRCSLQDFCFGSTCPSASFGGTLMGNISDKGYLIFVL